MAEDRTLEDFFKEQGWWEPNRLFPHVTNNKVRNFLQSLDTPGWKYFYNLCEKYTNSQSFTQGWSAKSVCNVAEALCGDRTQASMLEVIAALDVTPTLALDSVTRFHSPMLELDASKFAEFDYKDIYRFIRGIDEFSDIKPTMGDSFYRVPTIEQCYEISRQCPSHKYAYIRSGRDCEDFMRITRGWLSEQAYGDLPVCAITFSALKDGVTVYGHAVNLYIYHVDGELGCMLCEPQSSDVFWEVNELQPGTEGRVDETKYRRIVV